jgi:ribonuclease R
MMKKDPFEHREARNYAQPIASREFILDCMEKEGEPTGFKRLAEILEIEDNAEREALQHRLKAMVRDGQLMVDRRNIYAIASKMELITGKISAHTDGYGFLVTPKGEEDVFLSERQMRRVFHGDIAQVRVGGKDRRGRLQGDIVEVLERHTEQLVGRIFHDGDLCFVEPLNNRINTDILVPDAKAREQPEGQIVVVTVLQQPTGKGHVTAEITEVLGSQLTPDMEVGIALRNHDIPVDWPEEVLALVADMPDKVLDKDLVGRQDLRELPFVTIDGEDARDFDDAVYCQARSRGGWQLRVAIADVGHYVEVGSSLDQAAHARGTSVYFPQYVVPMLPEKLSNGLCSLNPYVDRLVIVCDMLISAAGRVSSYKFYEAVICSSARLTYTEVARLINSPSEPFQKPELVADVLELQNLYEVLVDMRKQRGALEFESTELQFLFDEKGSVSSITPRSRNIAHRIIEECMLCANVSAARFIVKHGKPGLFRVHEPPTAEKADQLRGFLSRFDVSLEEGDRPTTHDYQEVISQLREKKNSHVLQMALLRSMNQAVYQPENKGHFGLGYKEYAHFTSPIRRFPDLLMHRLIKSVIHSRTLSDWILRFGKSSKASYYPYEKLEVMALGEHTSFVERRADAAVYEVLEWIKCDYMSDRVGDIHDGVITGVAKFGFFVELVDVFVEGLIHVSTLAGDYYQYDQPSQTLVGERTGATYGMGDTVSVQVARVNVTERKMDFELISHTPLTSRRKAGGKRAKDKSAPRGKSKSRQAASSDAGVKPKSKAKSKAKDKRPVKNAASAAAKSDVPASASKPRRKPKAKPATSASTPANAAVQTGAVSDGDAPKAKPRRRRRR